ncbi:aminomethyltransferase [Rhizobium phaseoli]|nr:aminomethyltransferase [Rhizobium phaseoli]
MPRSGKGVFMPGLPLLPPGVERHPIPGGGSRAVELGAGDTFWIVDREGMQEGELVFFDVQGRARAGYIGATGSGLPTRLISLLARGGPSGTNVLRALSTAGFDLGRAEAVQIFHGGSSPADHLAFQADRPGLLIVGAVGDEMSVDSSVPLTELVLYVRRVKKQNEKGEFALPDPIGKPIYEHTILPGTAHSYEVKKGQYIQVIDVRGRECTDFQAFSRSDLDRGVESGIDQGATRSMTGTFHPTPGLLSKYYTTDLDPLLELVQDTSGHHDTFAIACTGRYYEDLGYFGHKNCSDNISNALSPYSIRPRRGWPTINFFFNLLQNDPHALASGEPWSRPGDFVLMRALTDLVCVNSGCPSDIDPANGWNPSEIHVRLYDETESFKRSVGYRMSPSAVAQDTKETPFHQKFADLGAEFVPYSGYFLPAHFRNTTVVDEYWAIRDKTVIMDLSALRKCEIIGPDAEEFLDGCITRDLSRLGIGGVYYTAVCNETGGMIDDGTIMRLGQHNFRWVGGSDASILSLQEQARKSALNVSVRNSTDQLCNLAIQGRNSLKVLASIFEPVTGRPAVSELARFMFTIARNGGQNGTPVLISRTGFTGEFGFEVFCHPKDAVTVFDLIWKAGQGFALKPVGLSALNIARVEAGYVTAGAEFCADRTPYDAGIDFTVPLKSKRRDFIGRSALEKVAVHRKRTLVTLAFETGEDVVPGSPVFSGSTRIGEVTSVCRSPLLGRTIALATMETASAVLDSQVAVGDLDGNQKRFSAVVRPMSIFDPSRLRVAGIYHIEESAPLVGSQRS